jgi:hypothetical protein
MSAYGSSTVKRRRRSDIELAQVDEAIVAAVESEHPVSLRGVYYRVVSAGAVEKTELGHRLVGRRLLALRREAVIPYSWITDGTRWISKPDSWSGLDQMLEDAAASYRRALWRDQAVEVHVFTEKDAISGVVMPVTARWDVPLGVLRGYTSESFAYSVAESVKAALYRGKNVYLYQLGDHDPSGVDAWRDLQAKVLGFLGRLAEPTHWEWGGVDYPVTFERIAVTEEQIAEYSLPTRPTKQKDSRAAGFTGGSVEVDAIPPTVLRGLVADAIIQHVDEESYRLTQVAEESERAVLYAMKGRSA